MSTTSGKSKLNNRQATINGILACGLVEETGRSKRYRVFKEDTRSGVPSFRWLVGKSGALRYVPAQCGTLDQSKSKTGTSNHRAFMYCGRLAESVRDGITSGQYRDIYCAVLRNEIPVTVEGYYAETK